MMCNPLASEFVAIVATRTKPLPTAGATGCGGVVVVFGLTRGCTVVVIVPAAQAKAALKTPRSSTPRTNDKPVCPTPTYYIITGKVLYSPPVTMRALLCHSINSYKPISINETHFL